MQAAAELAFQCFIIADATVSFDRIGPDGSLVRADAIHKVTLAALHQEFGVVLDSAALISDL